MEASKQENAKKAQGYTTITPSCGNCNFFSSEKIEVVPKMAWQPAVFEEKNKRCKLGDFAVKKTAWCSLYEER